MRQASAELGVGQEQAETLVADCLSLLASFLMRATASTGKQSEPGAGASGRPASPASSGRPCRGWRATAWAWRRPFRPGPYQKAMGAPPARRRDGSGWWDSSRGLSAPAPCRDEQQVTEVEDMLVRVMSHCLLLERMALEAVAALEAAGIPVRVLKGIAVAHLDYADPALRPFVDVDILLPTGEIDRAAAVLRPVGLRRNPCR